MRSCHDGHPHLRAQRDGQALYCDLFYRGAVITAQIPVKLFESPAALQRYYDALTPQSIAPVSRQTPLLSNLDVIENIALIKEVHEHTSRKEAHALGLQALARLGYADKARVRPDACGPDARFAAELIRASMMQNAKIVIVNPFVLLGDSKGIEWIADLLVRLERESTSLILDVRINQTKYETGGSRCRIIV